MRELLTLLAGFPASKRVLIAACAFLPVSLLSALQLPAAAPAATTVTWSTETPAQLKRQEGSGTIAGDGKLYVFGGYWGDPGWTPTDRADVYNPQNDRWFQLADLPVGISHAAVAAAGRSIYLAGGYPAEADGSGQIFATTAVWVYSIDNNSYAPLPSLPAARGAGGLVLVGTTLHYLGGTDINRADVTSHWTLDLAGGTAWQSAPPLPAPRNHLGAVLLNGKIYAVGGQTGQDASTVYRTSVFVYDLAAKTWSAAADLALPRSHSESSTFVLDGRIVVIGGQTVGSRPMADVTSYDPATDSWTPLTPLPGARTAGVGGTVDGKLVYTTGSMLATTYVGMFAPAASATVAPGASPSASPTSTAPGPSATATLRPAPTASPTALAAPSAAPSAGPAARSYRQLLPMMRR